jgi:ubiquinone/menaquinone biosynthesis C-methylase UbiE
MNANKALWEKGDFTRIAETMRESGEDVVRQAGITPGMRVLDLGCGDGNTAIPAAKLGANVLGVDIASNLVSAGNRRAAQAGLSSTCHFVEGDACDLGSIENKSFDLVISMFGAMFAPKPFDVAREMVRVTRPGGRIIMGNWIPNDPTLVAQILKISSSYTPPPPEGFVSPMTWGSTPHIIERFGAVGIASEAISWERDSYVFDFKGSPAEFVDTFRQYYGPTMNAFDAAAREGRTQALRDELVALFQSQNQSQYPNTTLVSATFLRVAVEVG